MTCRYEIFQAVDGIIRSKHKNEFTPQEVIDWMYDHGSKFAVSTIRTHIISRLCANTPDNHAVTYEDFDRIDDGLYRWKALKVNPYNVCVHEAGHAVVGTALGREVELMAIGLTRETKLPWCGGTDFADKELFLPFDAITILRAGELAEGAICAQVSERGAEKDHQDIKNVLEKLQLSQDQINALLLGSDATARKLIKLNLEIIKRLADFLILPPSEEYGGHTMNHRGGEPSILKHTVHYSVSDF